jgi:hypothetical protein
MVEEMEDEDGTTGSEEESEEEDLHEEGTMEEEDECMDKGDCIFMTAIKPEEVDIRATGNFLQHLAEAYNKNVKVKSFHDDIPNHLHDFEDIFSEESYDVLPECKQWDHAIELVPNAQMCNCKIYPLSPVEQKGLDEFIEENLASGQI